MAYQRQLANSKNIRTRTTLPPTPPPIHSTASSSSTPQAVTVSYSYNNNADIIAKKKSEKKKNNLQNLTKLPFGSTTRPTTTFIPYSVKASEPANTSSTSSYFQCNREKVNFRTSLPANKPNFRKSNTKNPNFPSSNSLQFDHVAQYFDGVCEGCCKT